MTNRENCQYVCKRKQTIGQECGAHPFQVYAPGRAGARPAPDATDRLAIALRAMRPPALSPPPSASASGNPGVPDSNITENGYDSFKGSRYETSEPPSPSSNSLLTLPRASTTAHSSNTTRDTILFGYATTGRSSAFTCPQAE